MNSLVGRAKTLPEGDVDHLRFGVVSCSNYEGGFFNAYGHLAQRNDLDAIVHLGDYIYEYGTGVYGLNLPDRINTPEYEILSLSDYRTRYSLYRLDPNLIRLHQQHTMISVWDDHESANDSYTDGAQNHQADEGSWEVRKAISKQVYFEWMPVADNTAQSIYRTFSYGNLCDLLMLDTRLEGRVEPPTNFDDPDVPVRTMISPTQMDWLTSNLKTSQARWKVVGNQVLFSTFNVGFAGGILDGSPDPTNIDSIRQVENAFIDNWESYPTQRNSIIDTIQQHQIDNVVIVTGDSHCSWAFDVTKEPVKYPLASQFYLPSANPFNPATGAGYTKATGAGSHAVEFATPSISSPNFDETFSATLANQLETYIGGPIPPFNLEYNPHLKYVDLDRHGYILLDIQPDTAQANFYYVPSQLLDSVAADFGQAAYTVDGQNRVLLNSTPSAPKSTQDIPTPVLPFGVVSGTTTPASFAWLGIAPNPVADIAYLQIAVNKPAQLAIAVYDLQGRRVQYQAPVLFREGMAQYRLDVSRLPAGTYTVSVEGDGKVVSRTVVVR